MLINKYGEFIYSENEVLDMLMQGIDISETDILTNNIPDKIIKTSNAVNLNLIDVIEEHITIEEYDKNNQNNWFMPEQYKTLDIAEHVLKLCKTQEELQRCGNELLMFQERNLFNLLRYLVYLVDTMKANNIIWGVGRGSSVASYVLYKLKVHKVDSMFYNLDVGEFLR
jgi:DNA polymerase III alpha subunit